MRGERERNDMRGEDEGRKEKKREWEKIIEDGGRKWKEKRKEKIRKKGKRKKKKRK